MSNGVAIEIFKNHSPDEIFGLILPIQRDEFGIPITRQAQPDLEQISSFYQGGSGNFWLAIDGGEIVGTIALKDIGGGQLCLRKMFVHRDYRGKDKGIAKQLLNTALSWSRSKDVSEIYLGTTAKFLAAHRFYEKNGFDEIAKADLPESFPVMEVDTKFYRYKFAR